MLRKALLAFIILFGSSLAASAQETYSVAVPAADVNLVQRSRILWNASVCARFALAASCTQAQACTAAGAPGGASCTAVQARSVDVEIFADTLAGREGFFIRKLLTRLRRDILARDIAGRDGDLQCTNWRAGNDTVKNAMCAAAGAPVPATVALGCNLCPDN